MLDLANIGHDFITSLWKRAPLFIVLSKHWQLKGVTFPSRLMGTWVSQGIYNSGFSFLQIPPARKPLLAQSVQHSAPWALCTGHCPQWPLCNRRANESEKSVSGHKLCGEVFHGARHLGKHGASASTTGLSHGGDSEGQAVCAGWMDTTGWELCLFTLFALCTNKNSCVILQCFLHGKIHYW